tara:strand:+ start:531 stop:1739 length:1209 start_codon:yes stop_codon:yes gene_type:complete
MKNKKSLIIIPIICIALAVGAYFLFFVGESDDASQANAQQQAMAVSVIEIEEQKIVFEKSLPGRVTPFKQSQVRPQVDGIITQRLFQEGAFVEKGEQLYQIDDARYKATLNSALADLKSANATVKSVESRTKRYEELIDINAVSQQELDDVRAEYDQAQASVAIAQAAVEIAQVNLDYTKVYAPISGRIGKSLVTEGALVTANQSQHLSVITQLDPIYVDIQQSGGDGLKFRSRLSKLRSVPVTVFIDDKSKTPYEQKGALKFSEVTVDETTGSVALRAIFPNPDNVLLPGLFVRTVLNLGEQDVILVPQRATQRKPDGSLGLWIVDENNQAQSKQIKAMEAYKDYWIVDEGLKVGDRVIVEGYQKVGPNMAVNPQAWSDENAPKNQSAQDSTQDTGSEEAE